MIAGFHRQNIPLLSLKKKKWASTNKRRKNEDESDKEKIGVWSLSGYSFASILMGSLWKITRFHRWVHEVMSYSNLFFFLTAQINGEDLLGYSGQILLLQL